jgi:hypothetical protein
MNSVIISDYGVMLAKSGERLVIRGPRPRLELIEGGPQLFLPLGVDNKRPTLSVVTSDGLKTPPLPLRRAHPNSNGIKPPKKSADEIESRRGLCFRHPRTSTLRGARRVRIVTCADGLPYSMHLQHGTRSSRVSHTDESSALARNSNRRFT